MKQVVSSVSLAVNALAAPIDSSAIMACDAEIMLGVGSRSNTPFLPYSSDRSAPRTLAGYVNFTKLGHYLGIKSGGQASVFCGNLKANTTRQITVQNGGVVPRQNNFKPAVQLA